MVNDETDDSDTGTRLNPCYTGGPWRETVTGECVGFPLSSKGLQKLCPEGNRFSS